MLPFIFNRTKQVTFMLATGLILIHPLTQADPLKPGGDLTHHRSQNRHALMHLGSHLSDQQRLNAIVGQSIFEKIWIPSPSATHSSDGLGPLYNARACSHCHIGNGRGQLKIREQENAKPSSLVVRLGRSDTRQSAYAGDPVYGEQLQNFAITGYQAEAEVRLGFEDINVRLNNEEQQVLQKPTLKLSKLKYGEMAEDTRYSLRLAPPLIGMGLLAAIDAQDIESFADPNDMNGDGISGRANKIVDPKTGQLKLARFNLKASSPTLEHQSLSAFSNDIGISSHLFRSDSGDCTARQAVCQRAPGGSPPAGNEAEINQLLSDAMMLYLENLAVPARRIKDVEAVAAGRALFLQSGCSSCHRPSYITGAVKNKSLSNQIIYPYSDLLLHDMGDGLADKVSNGLASGREWRTAPLWGVGLNKIITGSDNFLHDGRARSLSEAILWHGGEALTARNRFAQMSIQSREQLLEFLKSL